MKKTFYSETAYFVGMIALAFGTALSTIADLGLSMIVAPAYILHLKISELLPFFSFGMAGYIFQALIILLTVLVMRKFKLSYLFSFVTAVFYGLLLDLFLFLLPITLTLLPLRILFFASGVIMCAFGVSLLFNTYISPEAYELIVKEISKGFGIKIGKVKMAYDISSLILAVILSFAFFGVWTFKGIGWGTLIIPFINGPLIGMFDKLLHKRFEFKEALQRKKADK